MPTSLLQSLWYGEVPLWRTYWIYGVLVNGLLFGVAGSFVILLIGLRPVAVMYLAFVFVATAFNLVSVWRSAGNYTGPRVWAILARIAVVVGTLSLARGLYKFVDGTV